MLNSNFKYVSQGFGFSFKFTSPAKSLNYVAGCCSRWGLGGQITSMKAK